MNSRPAPRQLRGLLGVVVVLALLAGAALSWRYELIPGLAWPWDDDAPAATPSEPAQVPPPPGLALPAVREPEPVAGSWRPGRLDRTTVDVAIGSLLRSKDLGRHVLAAVAPLTGNRTTYTYQRGSGSAAIPASTTKVVTTTAALLALGPDRTFSTTTVLHGRANGKRRLVLVGGGDPLLVARARQPDGDRWAYPQRATLDDLAADTAAALRADGVKSVSLGYDTSLFTGPDVNPLWETRYLFQDDVAPISALFTNGGRDPASDDGERLPDPTASAVAQFAAALAREGITVVGRPAPVTAPRAAKARPVADVESPPVSQIVQEVLDLSDNEAAEVLLRHVALERGQPGSFEAGAAQMRAVLEDAGANFGASVFVDGSGLSRSNRLDPALMIGLLRLAISPEHPELRPVLEGLPVAGFSGTLGNRFAEADAVALGAVRAKTGSLNSVRALAGVAVGRDGVPMLFVLLADGFALEKTTLAWDAMDAAAGALAACQCSAASAR